MVISKRLSLLPPYLFAKIDALKAEVKSKMEIIDLGVGDPDLKTPDFIVDALCEGARLKKNQNYPSYQGELSLRIEVSNWYKKRFGVHLDPESEILILLGSKEGIAHMSFAICDPEDTVLVPDPSYPVYRNSAIICGSRVYKIPLFWENGFLPDLSKIPKAVLESSKLLFINYPNNPTSACCDLSFFEEIVDFAKKYNFFVAHDAAYTEIYGGEPPKSFLAADGAKDVGVEFHSFSKTFRMTGFRIGMCVGNRELIKALSILKSNIDSGVFKAIQFCGEKALCEYQKDTKEIVSQRETYKKRRDICVSSLKQIGFEVYPSDATFYVWAKVPHNFTSETFSLHLLKECGVVVTPGSGFGEFGEGYFRISLTVSESLLLEAMERMKQVL